MSYYNAHKGIDYATGTNEVYAAHDGVIQAYGQESADPCYFVESVCKARDLPIEVDKNGNEFCKAPVKRAVVNFPGDNFRTLYWHFSSLANKEGEDREWQKDDPVEAGDLLGFSGTTGCSTGNHLHLEVKNDSSSYDPFGYWSGSGNIEESFWGSSANVDDKSIGFQHFNNAGADWNFVDSSTMEGGRALYTFSSFPSPTHWSNWAFWTGTLETERLYEVKVYIPDYPAVIHKTRIEAIGLTKSQKDAIWSIDAQGRGTFKPTTLDALKALPVWADISADKQSKVIDLWNNRLAAKARYRIYHKGGYTDQEVDQNVNKGKWVSLGTYTFEAGSKAAVRLIDEVKDNQFKKEKVDALGSLNQEQKNQLFKTDNTDPALMNFIQTKRDDLLKLTFWSTLAQELQNQVFNLWDETHNQGKVIWADAVKWIIPGSEPPTPPPAPKLPDLVPVMDKDFKFNESQSLKSVQYDLTIRIKNQGYGAATAGSICFDPGFFYSCTGTAPIPRLEPGASALVTLAFSRSSTLSGDPLGTVEISGVSPKESNKSNNNLAIPSGKLNKVGGVDMTFAEMSGIKIDPASGQIRFILKGTEAKAGDAVIDLNATTTNLTKIFLQALAIPNSKHYISLDVVPDENGNLKGSSRVPSPFEQTDIADSFLKADVGMKFDIFANGHMDYASIWTTLIKQSSYWSELSSKRFDRYPDWIIAATIIPGEIKARQTGNDFFLEDVQVGINAGWWMREPTINVDGLGLSSAAITDVKARLVTYKKQMEDIVKKRATDWTIPQMNSANPVEPRFKDLKTVYAAIAAAQWYKEQVKNNPNLPYAALVDSENLTGIGMDTPFNKVYWDGQAFQDMGTFPCNLFSGSGTCGLLGGTSLENSKPEITGQLTETQDSILAQALSGDVVKTETASYLPGGTILAAAPDLELASLVPGAEKALKGAGANFTLQIANAGPEAAADIVIRLQDEVTGADGTKVVYPMPEQRVETLDAWTSTELSFDWTLPEVVGAHVISAIADPQNTLRELNEGNNLIQTVVETVDPRPVITLLSPDPGSVFHAGSMTFQALAEDPLTGVIEDGSRFSWTSSRSSALGTGTDLTVPTLSVGDHEITLVVEGPHGVSETKTFNLFIRELGAPLPKIRFPIDGARLSEELTHSFSGEAQDNEDGALSGSSLVWTSSRDGNLGTGKALLTRLSSGTHTLTLTAKDQDGQSSSARVAVTVEKGTPALTLFSPARSAVITEGEAFLFRASALDLQEGEISSRVQWSSDTQGLLNQDSEFEKILPTGVHLIAASVTDSDGLTASLEFTVTVRNTAPSVTLASPANQTRINFKDTVTFTGSAADLQDGPIPESALLWTSDRDGYLGAGSSIANSTLSPGWHVITLTATDSEGAQGTARIQIESYVGIPTVRLLRPALNQTFLEGTSVTFEATATDDQDGDLTGDSVVWSSSFSGPLGTGALLTLDSLPVGIHTIRVEARDRDGWKASAETTITVISKKPPASSILFPRENTSFLEGNKIYFYGQASDPEDGLISDSSLLWNSSKDGALGQGERLNRENLTVGRHTLTLTATDADGMQSVSRVNIIVTPLPLAVSITSPANGLIVKQDDPVTFTGAGADTFTWTSGLFGNLGSGASLTLNTLALGTHLITLTGSDSSGNSGTATTVITVVDEKSFNINQFEGGKSVTVLDFTQSLNHTLNIALPKEATVSGAQITLHPQRGLDDGTAETQFATTQFEEDTEIQPVSAEHGVVVSPGSNPVRPEQAPHASGQGGGKSDAENLSVMSTNYTVLDHYMSSKNASANPQRRSPPDFLAGEEMASWLKIGNLSEAGQMKWTWTSPTNWIHDCNVDIGTGYEWFAATCGWFSGQNNIIGAWKVDVYLKANSETEWKYYFTENFNVHETPNEPPQISNLRVNPSIIYENINVGAQFDASDNGQMTIVTIHWNDGTGWTQRSINMTIPPYYLPPGGSSSFGMGMASFSENTIVQYYVTVQDSEGNTTQTSTQSFTVLDSDTTGPAVSNFTTVEGAGADMDGVIDETENARISWSLSDSSGISNIEFVLDGQLQTPTVSGNTFTLDLPPLAVGDHPYTLTATDSDNSPATTAQSGTFTVAHRPLLLNPSFDAGADGVKEWSYAGELTEDTVLPDFAAALNAWLASQPAGPDGKVNVPLLFQGDKGSALRLSNLNISYRIIDTAPPVFGNIILDPAEPGPGQAFTATVTATDNVGVEKVRAAVDDGASIQLLKSSDSYSASFVAPAVGPHKIIITAEDSTGLISSETVPFTVIFNGPEFSVSSVSFDPSEPLLAGKPVIATVTLKNTGNQAAAPSVRFQPFEESAETQTVTLPAQSSATAFITFTLPQPGMHRFQIITDPENQMTESDETNNTWTQDYTVTDGTPPEITSVIFPETVGALQPLAVKINAVDNVGIAEVTAIMEGAEYPLAPGADGDFSATLIAPATLGRQSIALKVLDVSGLSAILSREVTVIDPRPNPFITASDITASSDNILVKETPEFKIALKNNGGAETDVAVTVTLDGLSVIERLVSLPLEEPVTLIFSGWTATSGSHVLNVVLDPENTMDERNEADNMAEYAFQVPYTLPPELTNLSIPENTLEGNSFTISADVSADQELKSVTITLNGADEAMTPAASPSYTFTGSLPAGTYPFTITAVNISDLASRLPGTLVVHPALPDLTISVPQISPLVLTNKDIAAFSVTLENQGFVPAPSARVIVRLDDTVIADEIAGLGPLDPLTWAATPGLHTLTMTADPENEVEEIDESNNTHILTFRVVNVIPPAIQSVSAPDILYTGQNFIVESVILDSVAFTAVFSVNNTETALGSDAEKGVYKATIVAPAIPGDYPVVLIAKNRDGLTSKWERTVTVLDSRPDFSIAPADIAIAPRSLTEDVQETLTALISNHGGSSAATTAILNVTTALGVSSAESSLVSIPAGGTATVSFPWVPAFGVNLLALTLDSNQIVEESDESNNAFSVSLFVKDVTSPSAPNLQGNPSVQAETLWSESREWRVAWAPVTEKNLKRYLWSLDGSPWADISLETSISLTITTAGRHSACALAEDLSGNTSPVSCTEILLDFAAPAAPVLSGGTNGAFSPSNSQTLVWSVPTDDASGPQNYRLKINGTESDLGLVNSDTRVWQDGIYTVQVAALDTLKHESLWSNEVVLKIDTTAPVAVNGLSSSTHSDPETWYQSGTPAFEWSAPADRSGIQGYNWYITENPDTVPGSQHLFTPETNVAIPESQALKTGRWYFHIVPLDNAGNQGPASHFPLLIDQTPPYTILSADGFNLLAVDLYSGVEKTYYRMGGMEWKSAAVLPPYNGKYQLEYYSVDNAGNKEEVRTGEIEFHAGSSWRRHWKEEEALTEEEEEEEKEGETIDTPSDEPVIDTPPMLKPTENPSFFRNIKVIYRKLRNVISWNSAEKTISFFVVYRGDCTEVSCSETDRVGAIRNKTRKRLRTLDIHAADSPPSPYTIVAYDRKGRVMEKGLAKSPEGR